MAQTGLIQNPRSRRNDRLALRLPAGLLAAAPTSPAELASSLLEYARREVDLLIVSGGDGTLRDVVSALPTAYGDAPLPSIALLAAGNANLVAGDVGACPADRDALGRLALAAQENRWKRESLRRALRVTGARDEPLLGFFGGGAVFAQAVRYSQDQVTSQGQLSVAVTLGVSMLRVIRGRGEWARGSEMSLAADGGAARTGQRLLFLFTSLDRLTFGIWPFWGGQGSIHHLEVDARPYRLGRSMLPLLRGQPTSAMLTGGYRSSASEELRLRMGEPLILDGEPFGGDPTREITIAAGPLLRFVSP